MYVRNCIPNRRKRLKSIILYRRLGLQALSRLHSVCQRCLFFRAAILNRHNPSLFACCMTDVEAFIATQSAKFEANLFELLRIPSVSADSRHRADVARAADWVATQFRSLNLATEVIPDGRASSGVRRIATGGWETGRSRVWPLRRAAARSAGRVDFAAVRADGARRQSLRPRRDRRQRANAHARQERGGVARRRPASCRCN